MIASDSREKLESCLVKALSRHIGYTSGAFDIDRIYSILHLFDAKPSVYESEVVDVLKNQSNCGNSESSYASDNSVGYLAEIINFATSMQLIEVVTSRSARIRRYAPTQTGRSVMGILEVDDKKFYHFFRTKITLMADADALMPILYFSQQESSSSDLIEKYRDFQNNLRIRRFQWLKQAFPEPRLLERITDILPWLERSNPPNVGTTVQTLTNNTARHHVGPRKSWLAQLGLVDTEGKLTQFGFDVKSAFFPNNKYFWLGPPERVQDALRISVLNQKVGPFEDSLSFVEPSNEPHLNAEIDILIEKTIEIMIAAYDKAKLVYAPQASLQIPIEYIKYRSYVEKVAYNWQDVLEKLFRRNRDLVVRYSARKGLVGFYKATKRSN